MRELLSCTICTGFWSALIVVFLPKMAIEVLATAGGNLLWQQGFSGQEQS